MNNKVSFKDNEGIWRAADEFRESKALQGLNRDPIDIIYIAEVVLKLNVIPVAGLFDSLKMDAALLPDLTGFYVDEESYLSWEAGQKWIERRLRFSFAHKIGHYVLHRCEVEERHFRSLHEFKVWAGNPSNYKRGDDVPALSHSIQYFVVPPF